MKSNSVFNIYFWIWLIVSAIILVFYHLVPAWYGVGGSLALIVLVMSNFLPRFYKTFVLTFIITLLSSLIALLIQFFTDYAYEKIVGFVVLIFTILLGGIIGLAFYRKMKAEK